MIKPAPITLEGYGVRLEPLTLDHRDGLAAAASDGELWRLWFTSVPHPSRTHQFGLGAGERMRRAFHRLLGQPPAALKRAVADCP